MKPITIPNVFATQAGAVPASELDVDFNACSAAINDLGTYSNYAVDTGTTNAYVVTFPSNITVTLAVPLQVVLVPTHINTGPSTITINGTSVPITYLNGSALVGGELGMGYPIELTYNGTSFTLPWLNTAIPGNQSGRLLAVQYVTSSGALSAYGGASQAYWYILGGGGAGGGSMLTSSGFSAVGGGGGAGGVVQGLRTIAESGYTVAIGAAGAGTDGAGGVGGTSSIANGSVTIASVHGGGGGGDETVNTALATAVGGSGGTSITTPSGWLSTPGAGGGIGITIPSLGNVSGQGASTAYGSGGLAFSTAPAAGNAASGYGAGGGGASLAQEQGPYNGGNGSAGLVVVYWYS